MKRKKVTGKFDDNNHAVIFFCILAVFHQPPLWCLEMFGYKTHPNFGTPHLGKTAISWGAGWGGKCSVMQNSYGKNHRSWAKKIETTVLGLC